MGGCPTRNYPQEGILQEVVPKEIVLRDAELSHTQFDVILAYRNSRTYQAVAAD